MGIRLSGLSSGMDTEALVSALMSSYNLKKDNMVKAQTKLSWKQDSWKSMNTSIYNFYYNSLNAAKSSKMYNVKSSSISDSLYAKVTASANAVAGTQSLSITKLAATGYLTGGKVYTSSGVDLNKNTKLSDLRNKDGGGAFSGGSLSVTVDGKSRDIQLTGDMKISDVVSQLKNAGLDASYDENNKRFFVSSKTSGKDGDFKLTANDAAGLQALQTMGLYTKDTTDLKEYQDWKNFTPEQIENLKISTAAAQYADQYNNATSTIKAIEQANTSRADMVTLQTTYQTALNDRFGAYKTGDVYDTDEIERLGLTDEFKTLSKSYDNITAEINKYDAAVTARDAAKDYVVLDSNNKAVAVTDTTSTVYAKVKDAVLNKTTDLGTSVANTIDAKKAAAEAALSATASDGASRVVGEDAVIWLNGAQFTNNTNSFTINGLTIQAQALTGATPVSITTESDIDGVYDSIKSFISEYNKLITAMDTAYNAKSAKGYEPLTSEEKKAMTDDEIKEWEKKVKDSLLRKDATLGNTSSAMKTAMLKSYTINGKSYSLSSFGIGTLGYFTSGDNEKGVLHINGDKDDTHTKGNDDKLREAIANDPEAVVSFFSSLANDMYSDLTTRMGSTSLSSIYTIYNDKQMATEYSEYKTKISNQETKIKTWEDYYYKKFSKMESALAKLNSNSSSLSNLLGG